MTTATLFDWRAERDLALAQVERNAGQDFAEAAREFVSGYLRHHSEASSEDITAAGAAAGIVCHDLRAWGGAFMSLCRRGVIEKAGYCARKRYGHGCNGGVVWRLTTAQERAI